MTNLLWRIELINMDIEAFRSYCLAKKGVTESFPFNAETIVFKVMGKMFTLSGLERIPAEVNLKCDPERSAQLREEYDGSIRGAYHMNKLHWNSVEIEGNVPTKLILELVDHSYDLVVAKLTRKLKEEHTNL
ncbi:MAG: putative DNA-binding protein (MmcQ/YjbR family) [Candidatus Latescibacterota bacterium]|jgi:predicted DNA-binding protein (MmcQ/YjbR family)